MVNLSQEDLELIKHGETIKLVKPNAIDGIEQYLEINDFKLLSLRELITLKENVSKVRLPLLDRQMFYTGEIFDEYNNEPIDMFKQSKEEHHRLKHEMLQKQDEIRNKFKPAIDKLTSIQDEIESQIKNKVINWRDSISSQECLETILDFKEYDLNKSIAILKTQQTSLEIEKIKELDAAVKNGLLLNSEENLMQELELEFNDVEKTDIKKLYESMAIKKYIAGKYNFEIQKLQEEFDYSIGIIELKKDIEEIKLLLPKRSLYFFSTEKKVFIEFEFKKEKNLLAFISKFTKEFGMEIYLNIIDENGKTYTVNEMMEICPDINPQSLMLLNKLSPDLQVTKEKERIEGFEDFNKPEIQQALLIKFHESVQKALLEKSKKESQE